MINVSDIVLLLSWGKEPKGTEIFSAHLLSVKVQDGVEDMPPYVSKLAIFFLFFCNFKNPPNKLYEVQLNNKLLQY